MSIKTISKRASDKMSKQPHEQDEQKATDGAQSSASGNDTGKGGASGRRRSRRFDKGAAGQDKPPQAAGAVGASAEPASTSGGSGGDKDSGKPGDSPGSKAQAGKSADSSADKAQAGKPADSNADKAQAGKSADSSADKAQAGKSTDSSADKAQAGKSADSSADKAQGGKPAGSSADKAQGGKSAGSSADKAQGGKTASGGPGKPAAPAGGSGDGKGGKAGIAAIVLVILLAIAVALFGWQAWQKLDAQQARLVELEDRTGELATDSEVVELERRLEQRLEQGESERDAALEGAIEALQGEFADYRSEVNETLDHVLAELSSEQEADERDWLHAEAAYLLRLANQRLQLERDVMGAAALLRTADQRLREADNPALVPVRREIASELAALDAVPRVDRTGLWMALDAQQQQIAGQPLAQDIEEVTVRSGMEEAPTGDWQHQLSRFGQELKDLVTIRHHDAELEALITPEQESYLRQSVRLVLEQAQLALLKEEQELFEASLDKALTMIEGYYDSSASGVQSVTQRLEELRTEAIRPELPDISGSQQALATFIERRFESRRGDDA